MNIEDRLRRASEEIDRATASLSAPPIAEVRRSARMRTVGVVMAAAFGAIVLVGGAVLVLSPGGETTIAPAGPGEMTTTTTVDASLSAPDLASLVAYATNDAQPAFEPIGDEIPFESLDASDVESDLVAFDDLDESIVFDTVDEVVVLGQVDDMHFYVLKGVWRGGEPESNLWPRPGECLVVVSSGAARFETCIGESELGAAWAGSSTMGGETIALGRLVGASVAAVRSVNEETWQITRSGYWAIPVSTPADELAVVTAYDLSGTVMFGPSSLVRDLNPMEEFDNCSAYTGISPSALALSSVPQPVAQTLFEIVEAAQTCDFDALEAVGGDTLTASFGGGDASELWAFEEENGYKPMYWLLSVLDMPYGTIDLGEELIYVWPAAATHDGGWDTMPDEYVDPLRAIYSEDDFEGFRQFGGYIGYRVGITESGDWSFFVVGD